MIVRAYAVYDSKAENYTPPFFLMQDGMATRQFQDLVNREDHPFQRHPQDYTLFLVGTYDDQSGKLEPMTPVSLGNGVEYQE